jgi:hypothetical protein
VSRGPIPDKSPCRPTVPDVVRIARDYLTRPGNSVGGNLHIVLADKNLEDGSVRYCYEQAAAARDVQGAWLARLLLQMTRTQRERVYAGRHGR